MQSNITWIWIYAKSSCKVFSCSGLDSLFHRMLYTRMNLKWWCNDDSIKLNYDITKLTFFISDIKLTLTLTVARASCVTWLSSRYFFGKWTRKYFKTPSKSRVSSSRRQHSSKAIATWNTTNSPWKFKSQKPGFTSLLGQS